MERLLSAALFSAAVSMAGCAASTLAGVSATTGAALAASAANRASGGCWALCTNGTSCNPRTGMCEEMPCRGLCSADEHCESTYADSKCVPGASGDVTAAAKGSGKTRLPVVPPQPPNLGGGPTIVPAAEQNPPSP
jgi:hypothetical protein